MNPESCIFCRIAAGAIPAALLLQDEDALALMDINPLADGHVLLIPRRHYETVDQMPPETAARMLQHVPALVRAVREATGCAGVNVLQNNGPAAHQEVPHVHFHILPRNPGDAFHFNWPAGQYPPGRLDQLANAIRSALE